MPSANDHHDHFGGAQRGGVRCAKKITRRYRRWALVPLITAAALVIGFVAPAPALAANGDLVKETDFSQACSSGLGVGIAFDGTNVWYSCFQSGTDLYKANPLTGQVIASYSVAGGLGALAWDGKRKKIWAGWGGAGTSC
jgi:hypothetical protein